MWRNGHSALCYPANKEGLTSYSLRQPLLLVQVIASYLPIFLLFWKYTHVFPFFCLSDLTSNYHVLLLSHKKWSGPDSDRHLRSVKSRRFGRLTYRPILELVLGSGYAKSFPGSYVSRSSPFLEASIMFPRSRTYSSVCGQKWRHSGMEL